MISQDHKVMMTSAWLALPMASLIYNREGRAILANKATRTYFGFTTQELETLSENYTIFKDESLIAAGLMPMVEAAYNAIPYTSQTIDYSPPDIYGIMTARKTKIQVSFMPLVFNNTTGDYIASYFHDVTEEFENREILMRKEQELQRAVAQQTVLQAEIEARSTPVVPIMEGILVLPLVGAIDSNRAQDLITDVLSAASEQNARSLILDITGVPVVDTAVANYLLQMIRALKLLGTDTILVGIGPDIAQTVVQLGLRLEDIHTRANLQSGLQTALQRQGLKIVKA